MKSHQRQSGSVWVIGTIVFAVVILAVLGFVVWKNISQSTNTSTDTNQTTPSDIKPEPSPSDNTEEGYLILEDWGVKFKIVDALKSTQIKYSVENDTYAFTTSRIEDLGGECKKAPYNVTVSLTRQAGKPQGGPMTLLNEEPINGYYYTTYGPPASCSAFDANGQMQPANQIEVDDRAALKEMLATISAN